MISKFKKGFGVFTCEDCGRQTRGAHNTNLPYCKECLEVGEQENVISDNSEPEVQEAARKEIKRLQEIIKHKGGKIGETE